MAHVHTITSGPRDRCPNCLGRARLRPLSTRSDRTALVCGYRCPRCGHQWYTSWNRAALGRGKAGRS